MTDHYDPNQPRDNHGRWGSGGGLGIARSFQLPLSSSEKEAINIYLSEEGAYDINSILRSGTHSKGYSLPQGKDGEVIKALDSAFRKTSLNKDLDLYRVVDNEIFKKLNKVGTVFKDKGFVSTSYDKNIANEYGFAGGTSVFKILTPKGFRALLLESSPYKEVLLNRDSRFKVVAPGILKAMT